MAARGPCSMVLLLSALLSVCLAQLTQGDSFREFVFQHVDYPKSSAAKSGSYCDIMMQERGMTRPSCKTTNIFIHAPVNEIKAICTNGGKHFRDNLFDSNMSFALTECRLVPRNFRRPCVYKSVSQTRRIRVTCNNWMPVHFDRIL